MTLQSTKPVDFEELASVLSSSIGVEKAREAISGAATGLGLEGTSLTRDDALSILENLTGTPGIVGVCARFARSRLMLKWASADLKDSPFASDPRT